MPKTVNIELNENHENDTKCQMDQEHLTLWRQMTFRYGGDHLKLTYSLICCLIETFSFFATLIFSLIDGSFGVSETLISHVLTCFVTFLIDLSNVGTHKIVKRKPSKKLVSSSIFTFIANLFMILKPYRYVESYLYRKKKSRELQDQFKLSQQPSSESDIEFVIVADQDELSYDYSNLIEVYVQNIPVSLFQIYLVFKSDEKFEFCTRTDLARSIMVLSAIISSSKAVCDYRWTSNNLLKSYYFLDYYKSKYTLHMNSCIQNKCTYIFNFISDFVLVFHLYCLTYFMVASIWLAGAYLFLMITSQFLMLHFIPGLRAVYENPPSGISTIFSNLLDRWINVFTTGHMTRFTNFSQKKYRICKWNFRVPLALWQIMPFVLTLSGVFLISYIAGDDWQNYLLTKSVRPGEVGKSTKELELQAEENTVMFSNDSSTVYIPCSNRTFHTSYEFIRQISQFIFESHQKVTNRFVYFNDIFGVVHMLWFTFVAYLSITITYSFYSTIFYINDDCFPRQISYNFWNILSTKLNKQSSEDKAIKLMVLTLVPFNEFCKISNRLKCFKCLLNEDKCISMAKELTKDLDRELDLDNRIRGYIDESRSEIKDELLHFYENTIMCSDSTLLCKLFLKFVYLLDYSLVNMTSYRIKETFSLMEIKI